MNKRDKKKTFDLQISSTGTLAHVNEKGGGGGIVMFYFDEKRRVEEWKAGGGEVGGKGGR